jgi:hypothetical protein
MNREYRERDLEDLGGKAGYRQRREGTGGGLKERLKKPEAAGK